MVHLPQPLSRRDRQQQTREALVFTARRVFAEDGYHAASLDRIAREAGFTKGAIYSNFEGKPALFLAVMDQNMQLGDVDIRDPFDETKAPTSTGRDLAEREGFPAAATQGFALATLEFISAAARDETLAPQLHRRLEDLLARYTKIAENVGPNDGTLPAADVGKLLAALDQGLGLILLSGDVPLDPALFNAGMRRLIDPARTAADDVAEA